MHYSRFVRRNYWAASTNDIFAGRQIRVMVARNSDKAVGGAVDLTGFEPLHDRAEIGMVVAEAHRNEGIGQQSLRMLCEYDFRFLHLPQVYAYVPVDNQICLQMFRACGFTNHILLKQWMRGSSEGYNDVILIQGFASDFQPDE